MKIYLSHHFLTLSIALITRLISSFALLRVSALTALDILIKNDFFYFTCRKKSHQRILIQLCAWVWLITASDCICPDSVHKMTKFHNKPHRYHQPAKEGQVF